MPLSDTAPTQNFPPLSPLESPWLAEHSLMLVLTAGLLCTWRSFALADNWLRSCEHLSVGLFLWPELLLNTSFICKTWFGVFFPSKLLVG